MPDLLDADQPPQEGRTNRESAHRMLLRAQNAVNDAEHLIRSDAKLTKKQREDLFRRLAGAVGSLEAVRYWLDMGAP